MMKKFMIFITFIGFIILIAATGAYDRASFTFTETLMKCLCGCSLMGIGIGGIRGIDMIRKRKEVDRRYQRIRAICDYEANQIHRII